MNLSRWNSYINIGDSRGLVYNSLTDRFLAVYNPAILDNLRNGKLDLLTEEFKDRLVEIGALISDDVDELSVLKQQIKRIDDDDSFFHVIINPTLDCNLHCWYCYENHNDKSVISKELIASVKQLVINKHKGNNNLSAILLSFFGGEPLLTFDNVIRDLLEWMRAYCREHSLKLHIHFTSNGVNLNKEIIEFLKDFDCSFQITLDGGKECHDNVRFEKGGVPTYSRIVNNIYDLNDAGIRAVVRINYTLQNIHSVRGIIDTFIERKISNPSILTFDFQKVWQDVISDSQETEIYELIHNYRKELRTHGFMVSNSKIANYVTDSCYADKTNEVLVNYNGDVFSCTARDFTKDNRKGRLLEDGNIEWLNTLFPDRSRLKMTKEVCKRCRIAPICGGGCHQKCLEMANNDACNLALDEKHIDEMILERFEEYFL